MNQTEGPLAGTMTGCWWVLHTKARHEKALASDLGRMGIESFLPLVKIRQLRAGQRSDVRIPLFPGYMFMNGNWDARYAALNTHRVANVIPVADQTRLQHELGQIRQMVSSEEPIDLSPRICRGRHVRVIKGVLSGLEGVVVRRRDSCRVHVAVGVLGQAAEVEIDASSLEIIEEAPVLSNQ